ncbi:MAG: hypothetical protein MJB57_08275 [Gemmatimonadetes bacterium]|nr:hypothetical protein [Gemmatimonadota bacterium]
MLATYDLVGGEARWPGFVPGDIPLALHDSAGTYLIRHPAPPAPFERLRGFAEVYAADTVLAELQANTAARIAGTWVATVIAPDGDWDPDRLAPLLLHEAFHAFQTVEHPEWTANEVDLFTYPVHSLDALHLRRLETAALRRAVSAPDSLRELCWAQAFLRNRRARFARLPSESAAYERGAELREGLARYVEARASREEPALPGDGFMPEDVRERAYESGHALAILLDRLAPGWKKELAAEGGHLDGVLRDAIGGMRARRCGASPDERGRSRSVARTDLRRLAERDDRARAAFDRAGPWRLEISGARDPLFPKQFDPLNVRVLGDRYVLHERWLQLANEAVELEVLDGSALTHGVGPHPMFDGVDRVEVTGLPEPAIETRGDTTRVVAEALTLAAVGLELEVARDDRVIRATLPRPGGR